MRGLAVPPGLSTPAAGYQTAVKKVIAVTLGVLSAIGGFVDVGDLVASIQSGARFGMSLAWVLVVGVVGICAYAETSAEFNPSCVE